MIQRFTYLGSVTIEHVMDGDVEAWNVYPLLPEDAPVRSQEPILAAPLPGALSCVAEAPPTRKRRSLWGVIRATWFVGFTALGEALTYALGNLTNLDLPPGTATAIGAVGYGVKRALWPNTTI